MGMLASLMMLATPVMLAPLRTLAELAMVFGKLMVVMIIGIHKVSGIIVVVVRLVIVTIARVIPCASGRQKPKE
jgi:hypothetical protein